MEFIAIVQKVMALFLIILVGVYGKKKNIITDEVATGLRNILLQITLPLLIINSFSLKFDEGMHKKLLLAFIFSLISFIIAGIISYIGLIPVKGEKKTILQFSNVFSNCGFMGFPIIDSIYGAEGVVYTSIFNMLFSLFIWTYGAMLFSDKLSKEAVKKVLVNPGIVAVYIGAPMLLLDIQLPAAIFDAFKIVGSMTTPISMLIVGSILANVKVQDIFSDITIYYGALLKMVIIPVAMVLIARLIKESSMVINTVIILQAMPAAAMTSIFADTFNKDKKYAAVLIFVTTLISIISIPMVVKLIS